MGSIGAWKGGGNTGRFPPLKSEKIVVETLFIATTFPDLVGKSIFLLVSSKIFKIFLKFFPTICVFRPNARKFNAWFLKNLAIYAKIMNFCNFLAPNFWKIVKYFLKFIKNFRPFVFFVKTRENWTQSV